MNEWYDDRMIGWNGDYWRNLIIEDFYYFILLFYVKLSLGVCRDCFVVLNRLG